MDKYAVIGNPVAHSKSPQIHAAFARATGQDMSYERLLAPLGGFVPAFEAFAQEGGCAVAVVEVEVHDRDPRQAPAIR